MKQFFVWTVAALIFAAGYALHLIYSDIKEVCAKQQFVSTTLCATLGGK
ncbi:hypothetical protein [Achromobacter mucicolens]